jgi:type IV pilus assembly protein PilB
LSDTKEKYFLNDAEVAQLAKKIDLERVLGFLREEKVIEKKTGWKDIAFYKPKKVDEHDDGYKGRIGIHEVLKMTPPIKDLIIKGSSSDAIELQAKTEGMMTMIEDGIFLAVRGMTSIEEVLRVVNE